MAIPEISPYLPSYATKPQVANPILPTNPLPYLQKRSVEYVKGLEGAQNFAMAPNSSAIVLDQDDNIFWVIATDQNGSKSLVQGYYIGSKYEPPKPVTLEDLMAQMQSMNERLNKMEAGSDNGQPDNRAAGQSKSNGAAVRNGQSVAVGKPDANASAKRSENE